MACLRPYACSPIAYYQTTSIRRAFVLPSKADVATLHAEASLLLSQITSLETDMLRLRNTLTLLDMKNPQNAFNDLKRYRASLSHELEDIRVFSCHSGVRLLPAELLEIIFEFACDSCDTFRTPLYISATCFFWRKIAISRAALWTYIYVSPDDPHTPVNLFLRRSAGLPLAVKIVGSRADDGPCPVDPRMARIFRSCERWRAADITLSLHEWEYLKKLCWRTDRFMPLLESFAGGAMVGGEDMAPCLLDFLDWSPLLYAATLYESTTEEMKRALEWSRLTDVVTQFSSETDILDIEFEKEIQVNGVSFGQDAVSQRHLTICGAIPRISAEMVITSLEIAPSIWSNHVLQRISALCIPMLEELTIIFSPESPDILTRYFPPMKSRKETCPFVGFLRSSKCQLKSLRIFVKGINSRYTINVGDLLAILELTPTLSHLSVIECAPSLITDELFKALSDTEFSPELKELELVWSSSGVTFDDALLGRMLDGRVAGGLSSVVLGARAGSEVSKGVLGFMETLRRKKVSARLW